MKKIKNLKQPILITGATGFIGANLVRHFVSKKIKVNIILRKNSNKWRIKDIIDKTNSFNVDLKDEKKLQQIIKIIKPKTIFHLAAHGAYSYQNDFKSIKDTILDGTINLINACKKYNFNIFINTGSSSEYGFKKKKMSEKNILVPNSYYSVFKSSSTLYCQFESLKSDLPIITIRPFHVYGPYEEPTRLIPTLIRELIQNKKSKLVSPKISRDLIYIDDVINFYIMIAKKNNLRGEIFNLGFGKKVTIKEIYNYIKKITNSKVSSKWNSLSNRSWDQTHWYSDMSHTKKKLDWSPKVNYKIGLYKTLTWYKYFYNE
ncbi:NAD(P)-dependent oxidoreductase [Candidatus Pelagibacter sp.]|nr:NAD(P)-dependent oxidoreductase [Candidatus Pelagibacter sp.]